MLEDGTVLRFTGIATATSRSITKDIQAQTLDAHPGAEPEEKQEAIAV